jgi:hypothetical protein
MNILLVISHADLENFLHPLLEKLNEREINFSCFFTGTGVLNLSNSKLLKSLNNSSKAIVCHQSWEKYFPKKKSPIEEGSQTNLSEMIAGDYKVFSL